MWQDARSGGDDLAAREAALALADWLRRGGYEPIWGTVQREGYFEWVNRTWRLSRQELRLAPVRR
jgi:hypothetical protein